MVEHLVPDEKNLPPDWVKSLYARGEPAVYRGKESETIGMPVGGIGAGQLYLLGDGTLGCWQIFNKAHFTGYGETNYARRIPESPVDQGFAVRIRNEGMSTVVKLGREDFPDIEFDGRYPIGRVRYRRDDLPVDIDLEAFSTYCWRTIRKTPRVSTYSVGWKTPSVFIAAKRLRGCAGPGSCRSREDRW